jgi:hypothetical protein
MKTIITVIFIAISFSASSQVSMNSKWTWMNGDSISDQMGVYGSIGVAAATNKPGARSLSAKLKDAAGNLWIFGGTGVATTTFSGQLNDLWKYNMTTKQWTWMKGDNTINPVASYGTQGVASATNKPSGRNGSVSWSDGSGNFWIYGGAAGASRYNDLWKYSISTNQWTWMKGDATTNASGIYGVQGTASATNKPGGRINASSWIDASGNLWLYGGSGYGELAGSTGFLNDLWKYNPTANQWTWVKGDKSINSIGLYGNKETASNSNSPGGRHSAISWTESGDVWLFGGLGYSNSSSGNLNDLWKYNIVSNQWTWMKGDSVVYPNSVFGVRGTEAIQNTPGGRYGSISWSAPGELILFAGNGMAGGFQRNLNDLWKYNITTNKWIWLRGDTTGNSLATYGNLGIISSQNFPGSRRSAVSWTDPIGIHWLFGGFGLTRASLGSLNDLWKLSTPPAGLPIATTVNASTVSYNSAQLNGLVDDNGGSTTVKFRYGTDPALTVFTEVAPTTGATVQEGDGSTPVSYNAGGLIQNTTYYFKVLASNSLGNSTGGQILSFTTTIPSPNANLSSLVLSTGSLTPAFSSASINYTSPNVSYYVTSVNVTPTSSESHALIIVNGTVTPSGTARNVVLNMGANSIITEVTAEDGTKKTYTINISRVATAPTTTTSTATVIQTNTVSLNGSVNDNGATTTTGFEYGSSSTLVGATRIAATTGGTINTGAGNTAIGVTISGISYGMTYYFRAWAINSTDTSFGNILSFTVASKVNMNSKWTWVHGDSSLNNHGVYGTIGVAAATNKPGSRMSAFTWTDSLGTFWLFGGDGYAASGVNAGALNDLWKYNVSTNQWTWVKGDSSINKFGVYGSKGVAALANKPGGRGKGVSWRDAAGNLWLFGGVGYANSRNVRLNDIWRYNVTTNQWTWVKGDSTSSAGVYGTKGTAAAANTPGGREGCMASRDTSGNVWLFGGFGHASSSGYLNDLWKYNSSTNQWTWVNGSNAGNPYATYLYHPGGMENAMSWTDGAGDLWIYGGYGYTYTTSTTNYIGLLADLWHYSIVGNGWARVTGNQTVFDRPIYGTMGIPDPNNYPGSRVNSTGWKDSDGNLWLYGGHGITSGSATGGYTGGPMEALWKFDVTTHIWTWMKGSMAANNPAIFSTLGSTSDINNPGSKFASASWIDAKGNFWLFGGLDTGAYRSFQNDLWKLGAAMPPTAVTISANEITMTGATLNATVNDNFNITTVSFDYGTDSTLTTATNVAATTGSPIAANSETTPSSAFLTGLTPGGKYFVRVRASNSAGIAIGSILSFATNLNPAAPIVNTMPVTSLTNTGVTLNGFVNENGSASTVSFEYGNSPTLSGGTIIAASTGGNIAAGTGRTAVSVTIGGLQPGAIYYYRAKSSNSIGTTEGNILKVTEQINITSQWAWMRGDSITNVYGEYGTRGVASTTNSPGGRRYGTAITDKEGNFWLFGGDGFADSIGIPEGKGFGGLNDLWKFDPNTNLWSWIKGAPISKSFGIYGSKGMTGPNNTPGARSGPGAWADSSGHLWIFGGSGNSSSTSGVLNDLWKYHIPSNQWTWMHGDNNANVDPIYGTKGISAPDNKPGSRHGGETWTDKHGNLWLFGGDGNSTSGRGLLNDLWKYNPLLNQWTWITGDNVRNSRGVFGTKGITAAGNTPGARYFASSWTDISGNLWLFAGNGTIGGPVNDLWKFDILSHQWTWMSGDSTVLSQSIYGIKGISSASNMPGYKYATVEWTDLAGNFWLGGDHVTTALWKYQPATNEWTWMGGDTSNLVKSGIYGTKGIADVNNQPGERSTAVGWKSKAGNFYLFGGGGRGSGSAQGDLNDVWRLSNNPSGASLATDYYRTISSGNWNSPATWESSPTADFSSGVLTPATRTPDFTANTISIRNGHTVTVTANVIVDQMTIATGANVLIKTGINLTVK